MDGNVKGTSDAKMNEVVRMAAGYDVIVLALGEGTIRGSGKDRTDGENVNRLNICLMGRQLELAQRMKATGKPVVVVYINMRPISEPWISENVDALVEAWCPGEADGRAVAEILFGDVNPGAKLPVTILKSVGQVKLTYNMLPNLPNRGYVEEQGRLPKPLYPFGYGLSFTTFELSEPTLEKTELGAHEGTKVMVTVKNTGNVQGDEVVQLYIRDDYLSWVARPVKELKGYK
jgi:beta-glucosidase